MAGATVTEAVFSYPGLGRLLLTALRAYDWPLVQGIALILAVAVVGGEPGRRGRGGAGEPAPAGLTDDATRV